MDRSLITSVGVPAIGRLLRMIHVARCTADKSLTAEFERLSSVPDDVLPLWRVVKARRRERDIFVQPNTALINDGTDAVLKAYAPTKEGLLASFVARYETAGLES